MGQVQLDYVIAGMIKDAIEKKKEDSLEYLFCGMSYDDYSAAYAVLKDGTDKEDFAVIEKAISSYGEALLKAEQIEMNMRQLRETIAALQSLMVDNPKALRVWKKRR